MTVDKKTLNAIKNHLLSKKQITLASFSESDVNEIVKMLKNDGLNVTLQGNKVILTEVQTEPQTKEVKPETKQEEKTQPEKKVEVKEEIKVKEDVKPETKTEEPKPVTQQQQRQKRSGALHVRLPIEYINYIASINQNTTYALKLIIFEHAKAHNVTLPEPKLVTNNITKKEKKMLKECLNLATKEEILQCLQSKLT